MTFEPTPPLASLKGKERARAIEVVVCDERITREGEPLMIYVDREEGSKSAFRAEKADFQV